MTLPVLAEVVRSGFVESRHRGSVVLLHPDGTVGYAAGRPDDPVLPRSSNKPLQAVALLRAGLVPPTPAHLAVVAASHAGEPGHVALVRDLLTGAGLDEAALGCPPDLPLGVAAAEALLRSGAAPARIVMNCSGKHAGMLAVAVANGWSTGDYLRPEHPVQLRCAATVAGLADEFVTATTVDGCGAPQHALSLLGLARAYLRLMTAPAGSPERAVVTAMSTHPWEVGGTDRDATALMRALPGAVAKDGAEGVYALALADGTAVALKIEDGAARARVPVLLAVLQRVGVAVHLPPVVVLGGGVPVGEVRATLP